MTKSPSSILLFEEAEKRGYKPVWKTPYGFFTFMVNGKTKYAYQTKSIANTQLYSWLTSDKYATRVVLEENGLPNIPYCYSKNKKDLADFFDIHHPIVAKPVLGEMSKGVVLIDKKESLTTIDLKKTICEKYIEGDEYRVMLLGGEAIAMQRKELHSTKANPWAKKRINLNENEWYKEMIQLSKTIHSLVPQGLLAVDFILDKQKKIWILELNSMPGLWFFAYPDGGEPINLASRLLDFMI